MTDKLVIYTDGGARGNPGPAAIGVAVYSLTDTHEPLKKLGKFLGHTTNNEAEYHAVLAGLDLAKELGGRDLVFYLDSELVVRQLSGQYKIKEPRLQSLAQDVIRAQNQFERVEFHHVSREKNKLADELVNEALDAAGF